MTPNARLAPVAIPFPATPTVAMLDLMMAASEDGALAVYERLKALAEEAVNA